MVDNTIYLYYTCFIYNITGNTAVIYNSVPKLPIRYAVHHNILLLFNKKNVGIHILFVVHVQNAYVI